MMGVDTRERRDLLLVSLSLNQCYLCQQSPDHCGWWERGQAWVAWELLVMRAEGETDLSLDPTGGQQAEHRQQG